MQRGLPAKRPPRLLELLSGEKAGLIESNREANLA